MVSEVSRERPAFHRGTSATAGFVLDLVVAELEPRAASLLVVDEREKVCCHAARVPGSIGDARREVENWHRRVGARSPLRAAAVAEFDRPVITIADLGPGGRILRENAVRFDAYRRIGAIDDTRLLIRDGRRLAALIALWRPLRSAPWGEGELRQLKALQPLVEMVWIGSAPAVASPAHSLENLLEAELTPRQLEVAELLAAGATNPEVARALGISPNTVKTHARVALNKLGAASRHELLLGLRSPSATR